MIDHENTPIEDEPEGNGCCCAVLFVICALFTVYGVVAALEKWL